MNNKIHVKIDFIFSLLGILFYSYSYYILAPLNVLFSLCFFKSPMSLFCTGTKWKMAPKKVRLGQDFGWFCTKVQKASSKADYIIIKLVTAPTLINRQCQQYIALCLHIPHVINLLLTLLATQDNSFHSLLESFMIEESTHNRDYSEKTV